MGRRSRLRSRRKVHNSQKAGWISTCSLDAAYLHGPSTNTRFLLVVAAETGEREVIQEMAKRISEWVKESRGLAEQSN